MAKALVTQERVFEVAQGLVEQGIAPTILNVQDGIGGGSYTTVKRYLDQWREAAPKQRRPVELPEAAVAKLMSLGREFWALLDEQAGQQVEAIRAATGEEIAAIQAQLDQAEQAIARLEAERDQAESRAVEQEQAHREAVQAHQAQTERVAAAEAKAGELAERVADLKGELQLAHAQHAAEREAATTARAEAQAAAVEAARLQGELTALRTQRVK
jgi:chromosome segregation ATPase